jgi:hypothetical protein
LLGWSHCLHGIDGDEAGFFQPERKMITFDLDFHGIT